MAITAKPTSYSLNTGHAYFPTHLWMLDDSTGGTNGNDQGSGTPLDMTLQNVAMWATDTGDLESQVMTCSSGSSYYALSATGTVWDPTKDVCLVVIAKTDSSTQPSTAEYTISYATSSGSSGYGGIRCPVSPTDGIQVIANDGTNTRSDNNATVDFYDTTWHLLIAKVRPQAASNTIIATSIDGGAFDVGASTTLLTTYTPDRYALGVRGVSSPTTPFNGKLLAAWVYEGSGSDWAGTWNDAWAAALYADPWQFLTVGGANKLIGKFGGKFRGKI